MKSSCGSRAVMMLFSVALSACPAIAAPDPSGGSVPITPDMRTGPEIKHFTPPTRKESDDAIAEYKRTGAVVAEKLKLKLDTIETPHFLVFTNWDPREYGFLKENVELAYNCVSKQFELPVAQNVFLGKLPIYMFADRKEFEQFSKEIDGFDSSKLGGYYSGNSLGIGHMAMWKPDIKSAGGDRHLAEWRWGYVLVHEFTHAFIARYRTSAFIPRWLNEGIAEVVANRQFPRAGAYHLAKLAAGKGSLMLDMLDIKEMSAFTAAQYPIAQTTVETLIAGGPKIFLKYFNDVKEGISADEALQREYKVDRKGLESAWKKYVKGLEDK
jgi:hypothetical protein